VLGPPDGRYVLRGHAGEPEHVLVLETLGAPQRHLLGGRRARKAPPGPPPEPVTTARATLIGARPFDAPGDGERWLAAVDLDTEAARAVDVLNRVLHAHRTASADPFVREVAPGQAIAVRVGIGVGEEVAHGRWTAARALSRPGSRARGGRRAGALRPQERLAALLGGRDAALAAEELALRARLDLDRGRTREAALQLRVALEAGLAELQAWAHHGDLDARLAELRDARPAVAAAANRALEGGLDAAQVDDVARILDRLEAALTARVAAGLE
jgi:hypothetical protein